MSTNATVTVYTKPACVQCNATYKALDKQGVAYDVVDIEQHPEAAEIVMAANGGNQTVPTLVYSDGTSMTNPSAKQVQAKLASL